MIILIKTDSPIAELYLYGTQKMINSFTWQADRNLAMELLPAIQKLLSDSKVKESELTGIGIFTGAGSFTGLRIGTTVANTLSYSLNIPVVESEGKDWIQLGIQKIESTQTGQYVVPKYSAPPNITTPKPKT